MKNNVEKIFSDQEVESLQSGLSASRKDVRAIESAVIEKLNAPDSEFLIIPKRHLEMFADLMKEASQVIQDPKNSREPLVDELDGCVYIANDYLNDKKKVAQRLNIRHSN